MAAPVVDYSAYGVDQFTGNIRGLRRPAFV